MARKKLRMEWANVHASLEQITSLCGVIATVERETQQMGVWIAERYKLNIFDAVMIAAALDLGSRVFWSEDMQDGLVVRDSLTIRNPFKTPVA